MPDMGVMLEALAEISVRALLQRVFHACAHIIIANKCTQLRSVLRKPVAMYLATVALQLQAIAILFVRAAG